jgi:hypothetical protein
LEIVEGVETFKTAAAEVSVEGQELDTIILYLLLLRALETLFSINDGLVSPDRLE